MNSHTEIYVADFETTTTPDKCWVWAFGYARIFKENIHYGGSIKEFLELILKGKSKKIYFHNLKFDGKFIMYYLFKQGYTMVENPKEDNEFSALVDDSGAFYSIKIPFYNKRGIKQYATILDSLKIFPTSLRRAAVDYNLEYKKGDLDYDKVRYENHKMTNEEKEYLAGDINILRRLIEIAQTSGFKKMTIASIAFDYYKSNLLLGGIKFEKLFPKLSDIEFTFMKRAYRGGVSMVNEKYRDKIVPTNSYDVNSMYPFILRYFKLPYGKPLYFTGKYEKDDKYDLYIQHFKAEFYIKEGKAPCVQIKTNPLFLPNEWVKNCPVVAEMWLTNVDLDMFFKTYDIAQIEYIDGYKLKSIGGMFNNYVDYWYNIKCTSKGEPKAKAKLMLNSLYGKFGMKPVRKSLILGLKDNVISHIGDYISVVDTIYIPVSIFVTSYARYYLLTYINKYYDKFIYCDTDSIHLTEKVEGIPEDSKKLGYFKHEYSGVGRYLKQKCYIVKYNKEYCYTNDDGEYVDTKVVCAGLNKNLLDRNISLEDFHYGAVFTKLKAKNIEGGVALVKEPHVITEPPIPLLEKKMRRGTISI